MPWWSVWKGRGKEGGREGGKEGGMHKREDPSIGRLY